MTAKESDIYGNMTRILQRNSGYDGQFSLIDRVFSPHEHGLEAELQRRLGDFEKALGSVGGPSIVFQYIGRLVGGHRHERQCLRHPSAITKGRFLLEMSKMKIDPTMYMKTQGGDDKRSVAMQHFHTKMHQSPDIRQTSVGFAGRKCRSYALQGNGCRLLLSKLAEDYRTPCGSAAPLREKAPPFRPRLPIVTSSAPPPPMDRGRRRGGGWRLFSCHGKVKPFRIASGEAAGRRRVAGA